MFERFSFSLSRMFRLRSRRGTKANAGSARITRRSTSGPSPSKSRRPGISQLEPINATLTSSTTRPRSFFTPSILSPIAQSPITTSTGVTPIPDTLTPILIIGRDPAPALLDDVGPQTHVDPADPNTRRISFQFPAAHAEEPPESPLSTCSTLVPDVEAEAEIRPTVPPKQSLASGGPDSGSVSSVSVEPDVGLDNAVRSGSGRARPVSLFSPQPVRVDVSRFSLPAAPTTPTVTASTNARDSRKESKRMSLMSLILGVGDAHQYSVMLM